MFHLLNKVSIRKSLREKRRAITQPERQLAAHLAAQRFIAQPFFKNSQNIGCYIANQEEFDCLPIIQALWQAQKNCYIPRLSKSQEKIIEFAHYQENTPLLPNCYYILEPQGTHIIAPEELDLVILPLIGFDLHGNRLGMGAGYYDRTFAFLLKKTQKKPIMIGLGYTHQKIDTIPHDPWDISLNYMLTETELFAF